MLHDVVIVGGGPIGLELAIALDRAGIENLVIEAGCVGSTMSWWAPGTTFFSSPERIAIAGVPLDSPDQSKTSRERYLTYLRAVVRQFRPRVRTYTRVTRIEREGEVFALHVVPSETGVGGPSEILRRADQPIDTRDAEVVRCRRLVLAIGDMHRPRRLDVPGEDLPHVSHYLDDPHVYFGRRVLIVGGKNSAVEAALRLHRVGCDLTISYRGSAFDPRRVKYWLRPELEWLIERGDIRFLPRTVVERLDPGGPGVRSHLKATLRPCDDSGAAVGSLDADNAIELNVDDVLLLIGYEQDPSLFEQLGIELVGDARAPRHTPSTMETNVPGVYVAGTAVGGSQSRARVFIENSHVHVARIVTALGAEPPSWAVEGERYQSLEES